jgi:hypothetical protein
MASKKHRTAGIIIAILMIGSILLFALIPLFTATGLNP